MKHNSLLASYTAKPSYIMHVSVLRVYMPAALNLVLCTQLLIRTTKLIPQASSVLVFFVPARAFLLLSRAQSLPCSSAPPLLSSFHLPHQPKQHQQQTIHNLPVPPNKRPPEARNYSTHRSQSAKCEAPLLYFSNSTKFLCLERSFRAS